MKAELHAGDEAPDFSGASAVPGSESAKTFNLAGLRGQRVALCFYSFEEVPAATQQLSGLRDAWDRIGPHAALFAISREKVEKLQRVVAELGLPFALVSDENNEAARAYGIWLGDGGGGDVEGGSLTERSTFIIAGSGRIEAILRDAKPADHAAQLAALLNG